MAGQKGNRFSRYGAENPSPDNTPAGVEFPLGFFDFNITGIDNGASSTLTLYLPPGVQPDTYWKYGPTPDNPAPHWYEFLYDGETGAQFIGNIIVLHFVDGLRGDDDLTANGVISDAGGPGMSQLIPSLNTWGAIILVLMISLISIRKKTRRKIRS